MKLTKRHIGVAGLTALVRRHHGNTAVSGGALIAILRLAEESLHTKRDSSLRSE